MMIELVAMAALYTDLNNVATSVEEAFVAPMADVPTVVEAPYWSWGLRPVIRDAKRDFDLDIIYRRGSTCDLYPDRRCLKVTKEYLPEEEWYGVYFFEGDDSPFRIIFNTATIKVDTSLKDNTAAHEFGHFLGFSHHDDEGVMGINSWYRHNRPGPVESAVLYDYYVLEFE